MFTLTKKIILFLFLILVGTGIFIFLNLHTIIETVVKKNLQQRGLNQLNFKITELSFQHLVIENLTWDKYCLNIKKINYSFSIGNLLNHQYGKLLAEDINSCYTHETTPSNQTTSSTLTQFFPVLKNLNFERIYLKNLKNSFYLGNTQLDISLNMEYISLPNAKEINLQVELKQGLATSHFTLKSFFSDQTEKMHIPYLEIEGLDKMKIIANNLHFSSTKNNTDFIFTLNSDQLSFNHFLLKDVSIKNTIINLQNHQHQGQLEIKQFEDLHLGLRNLKIESTYLLNNQQISVDTNIVPTNKLFKLNLLGKYDWGKKNGLFTLFIPTVKVNDIKSIDHFFLISPLLKLNSLVFNIDVKGTIRIKNNVARPLLALNLTDLAMVQNQINLKGIHAILNLSNFSPLIASSEIQAPILAWPIPIRNFKTSFSLHPNIVTCNSLTFNLWDGEFKLAPTIFNTAEKSLTPTELSFSSVNLTQVFTYIDKPNLKGTGKIGGILPITFNNLMPMITNGHLFSEGNGNLQLRLQPETKQALVNSQHINILTDYLDNLNYNKINLNLSTNEKLDIKSQIKISGTNPVLQDKYQGRPLDFKMTLNFNLVKMLRSQGASLQLPEKIEKLFLKDGN